MWCYKRIAFYDGIERENMSCNCLAIETRQDTGNDFLVIVRSTFSLNYQYDLLLIYPTREWRLGQKSSTMVETERGEVFIQNHTGWKFQFYHLAGSKAIFFQRTNFNFMLKYIQNAS